MSATVRIWVLSNGTESVVCHNAAKDGLVMTSLDNLADGWLDMLVYASDRKGLKEYERTWNETVAATTEPEQGQHFFVKPVRLRVSLVNGMTLNVKDDREPWLIHYGRLLASAVRKEEEARQAHLDATDNVRQIVKDIADLGAAINKHLGSPDADKMSLEGELER